MDAIESKRMTGRTTRMLEEAVRAAKEGHAVYVVMADQRQIAMYRASPRYKGIKFETFDGLRLSLDIETLRMRGAHPNCRLFVDHYAIERRFGALIREWARYDSASGT